MNAENHDIVAEIIPTTTGNDVEEAQKRTKEELVHEDAKHYFSGWSLFFLVLAFMVSSFMLALDNTVLGS